MRADARDAAGAPAWAPDFGLVYLSLGSLGSADNFARHQASPGTVKAAGRIERVARTGEPALR